MLKNKYSISRRSASAKGRHGKYNTGTRITDHITVVIFVIVLFTYTIFGPGIDGQASESENKNNTPDSSRTSVNSETQSSSHIEPSAQGDASDGTDSQADTQAVAVSAVTASDGEQYTEISDDYLAEISTFDVLVLRENGNVDSIPIEKYVAGVVASEMPSSFQLEALKAQAVAARTYVCSRRDTYAAGKSKHPEAYVCDTTCCQVYRDTESLRSVKSDEWVNTDFHKIKTAVAETAGQLLYYDGELVAQPLFFSASGGRTENSEDVFTTALPYLRSVNSEYDNAEKYINYETSIKYSELQSLLSTYGTVSLTPDNIKILSHTEGDGVALIEFDTLQLTGRQVRELLNLPSSDFTVETTAETVTFISNGNGHRVGLSQYGANGMAENGYTYQDILKHYYSGTSVV